MRIYICGVLTTLAAVLCAGCAQDEGNYDYHELNDPVITGVADSMSVLIHDQLTLDPSMGDNITDTTAYDYEWKAINRSGDNEVTVLGHYKKLSQEVSLNAGEYMLYFTATERSTGLFWRKNYALTVSDSSSEGWMVLCDADGKTRLDIISKVTGKTYRDVLSANGMPELNGPYAIQYEPNSGYTDSPFYLFTEDGATRLSKNNFAWQRDYLFKYEVAQSPDVAPRSMVCEQNGISRVFVSDGKVHYAQNMGIQGLFGSAANKDFDVAPAVGVNIGAQSYVSIYLLYDTTNKRFMAYCPLIQSAGFNASTLQTMPDMEQICIGSKGSDMVTGSAFTDYPEGMDFVYMENTNYDPGNAKMGITYTVLRNGSKYYLYGIQLGDLITYSDCTFGIGKAYYGDLSQCTDINRAQCFAFSSLRNYMYYAVDGNIYRVDLSEKPLRAERQISLLGETITCMKFNIYRSTSTTANYDLVVGSEKQGSGILRIYNGMTKEGDFSGVAPTLYTGFAQIVDATYRERTN